MSSIACTGSSASAALWNTGAARIRTHSEATQSSLTLHVRTAEGDTVELSFDASSLSQVETASTRSQYAKAGYSRTTQSATQDFRASIHGDLNDQEMSDIASLIQSLRSGQTGATPLSSLAAYSGSFRQTTTVTDTFRVYA